MASLRVGRLMTHHRSSMSEWFGLVGMTTKADADTGERAVGIWGIDRIESLRRSGVMVKMMEGSRIGKELILIWGRVAIEGDMLLVMMRIVVVFDEGG